MTMRQRVLGSQGLTVSELGLGCMGLTASYGEDTRTARPEEVIDAALELGITFLDTADAYGPHTNEEAVGRAVRHRRQAVRLATKFGVERRPGISDGLTSVGINGRPEYVRRACDASLQRLGTDHVDVYLQHRLDPDTPIEETVGAMGELVHAGKALAIGLCEVGPTTLQRAHATFPVSVLQLEYSLWHREPEQAILPAAAELGIGIVAYSPLGRGFLTGRIRTAADLAEDDWRRHSPRFQGENLRRNLQLVDRIRDLAQARGATPAQLALAWLLSHPRVVPIQGATRRIEVQDNAAAVDLELTADDCATIDALAPIGVAAGDAWPAGTPGAAIDRD